MNDKLRISKDLLYSDRLHAGFIVLFVLFCLGFFFGGGGFTRIIFGLLILFFSIIFITFNF